MSTSPTQLSLRWLRERGFRVAITETWNSFAKIRQDLFGFIDLLAVGQGRYWEFKIVDGKNVPVDMDNVSTVAVQTTSYPNMGARVRKIQGNDMLPILKKAGWVIQVHGWRKVKNRWEVKITEL